MKTKDQETKKGARLMDSDEVAGVVEFIRSVATHRKIFSVKVINEMSLSIDTEGSVYPPLTLAVEDGYLYVVSGISGAKTNDVSCIDAFKSLYKRETLARKSAKCLSAVILSFLIGTSMYGIYTFIFGVI